MAERERTEPEWPAFLREIDGTLAVSSQYILHGNIRDRVLQRSPGAADLKLRELPEALWEVLSASGYACLIWYDLVHGISVYPDWPSPRRAAEYLIGKRAIGQRPDPRGLRAYLAAVVGTTPPTVEHGTGGDRTDLQVAMANVDARPRAAFVVDFAARLLKTPHAQEDAEREFFLFCQKMAVTAQRHLGGPEHRPAPLYNPVIWLVQGERDLPSWFVTSSERIRTVGVPIPELTDRIAVSAHLARTRYGIEPPPTATAKDSPEVRQIEEFARRTDGLSVRAMEEIARLALDRDFPFAAMPDAIRIYKLGIEDNPWRRDSVRGEIRKGEQTIRNKVLGQERAILKTLDILKRSALGLSGAQATSTSTRPRGVLFFAGPTGVGKTELAKNVAELLFGDSTAYLRFDMSEFAAEHSADRLIGSPPGYVGFEAGGQLTGAVRRRPFQVILFDEIEKAHPLVMDKFLQILEDGRLTDGQGITTYFSECVLIFTSNLGVMVTDPDTKKKSRIVDLDTPPDILEQTVRRAIEAHFTEVIGRPELLNRFGDNIVVFGFIDEATAKKIFDLQIINIVQRVKREQDITLEIADDVKTLLCKLCTDDLDNGGRGIGNRLETHLINPLARFIFDNDVPPRHTIEVHGLRPTADRTGVDLVATTKPSEE